MRRRHAALLAGAACALQFPAAIPLTIAQAPGPPANATAIIDAGSGVVALEHASVIDGTGASARPDQTLLIENGRIRDVGRAADVVVPSGARTFDLAGQSVLPGLVSLHDHIMNQASSAPALFLAFGVTTVRTAGGSEPHADLNLKRRIDSGRVPGPELFVTGPFLNQGDVGFIFMKTVRDDDDARRAVRYWASEGVTSIKVYTGIARAMLRVIVDEAHRLRLPVLGHLGSVTCRDAAEAGIDTIEHGFGSCGSDLRDDAAGTLRGFEIAAGTNPQSSAAQSLIRTLVDHHVTITPTPPDLRPPSIDELDAMHPGMQAEFLRRTAARTLGPGRIPESDDKQGPAGLEVAFARAGGRVGLGADCTPTNVTRIPGFANLKALKLLYSDRGFSPLEAIRIATLNGASILKIDDRTGSIAKGKEADLLIVKGDPSVHLKDVDQVTMVFSNGVAYDPRALLASVRGLYGRP